MDKTTQDLAWRCLPREFREEVKKEWKKTDNNTAKWTIEYFFSKHNLTSDAEGEDKLLCVSHKFDKIINQSFADHNRLHIAAILAAGMLASEVRCYPVDRALELADKLIAECEKGDNNA